MINDILVLKTCIVFLVIQILLIIVLFLFYLKNILSRMLQQYIFEKYEFYIMEATVGKVDKSSPIFRTAPFVKNVLRVIIIDKIMSVGGEARKGLIELYKDMGFDKYDEKLLSSSQWYHKVSAISFLTITKSEKLRDKLPLLINDNNLSVRVAAIKAISTLNLKEYTLDIIKCMETLPDWVNERISPLLLKIEKVPYEEILLIFNKSSERIKRYIVPLLFETDREQALWDLTNNFDSYDFETQISIVKSIHNVDNIEKMLGFVETIMNSEKWELKAQLVKSLGKIKDERAIPYLIIGLDDKNWFVRFNSAVSIASFGDKGLSLLTRFADEKSGFKSDIAKYILDLSRYGFLSEEIKG
ncbi:MAG: HEAT repeat domain-containing protein [Deltaproteobacteria bacterium]|nr:HEAT repeat domain-containing protein [Deltaproteobacteria bacterium]